MDFERKKKKKKVISVLRTVLIYALNSNVRYVTRRQF